MPRDGSGAYTLPSGNPVVTQTPISSTVENITVMDMADALTQSISKDGQTAATANLPMGGFKHTNVADATLANQYATLGQAQSNVSAYVVDTSVTLNTITINPSPPITAYVAGQHWFVKLNNTNLGQTAMTVSGLTPKSVFLPGGVNLRAASLRAGHIVLLVDVGPHFIVMNVRASGFISRTAFGASSQWLKPPGWLFSLLYLWGSGGGGGGVSSVGTPHAAGGGGAGGLIILLSSAFGAIESVTINAGGAGGAPGGNGSNGGSVSFGSHCTALGGLGGEGSNAHANLGGIGGQGTGAGIIVAGYPGGHGIADVSNGLWAMAGKGADSLGGGGRGALRVSPGAPGPAAGEGGNAFGAGGGGAASLGGGAGASGGAGALGGAIVEDYGI